METAPITTADICKARGWTPGTVVQGTKNNAIMTVRITAIGETTTLGRRLTTGMKPDLREEREWGFTTQGWEWQRVGDRGAAPESMKDRVLRVLAGPYGADAGMDSATLAQVAAIVDRMEP